MRQSTVCSKRAVCSCRPQRWPPRPCAVQGDVKPSNGVEAENNDDDSSPLMVVMREALPEAPVPLDEQQRWDSLVEYNILDTVRIVLSKHYHASIAPILLLFIQAVYLNTDMPAGQCCSSPCVKVMLHALPPPRPTKKGLLPGPTAHCVCVNATLRRSRKRHMIA